MINILGRKKLILKKENGTHFYYRPKLIKGISFELEEFLSGQVKLNSRAFAHHALFSEEIRSNNQVEGYGDSIQNIEQAIENASSIPNQDKRTRILNLYYAYRYILTHKSITPETLRELYAITSKDLLNQEELSAMGDYYRARPVYIYHKGRTVPYFDSGMPVERINEFMDMYFEFLNSDLDGTETTDYIKSQILHLYFVYIHPYYDVNGRTSRTLAMWYLLNKEAYAYIIFNRGISLNRSLYSSSIEKTIKSGDMTYFLTMMLETVQEELEKEYLINCIAERATSKLSPTDFQSLLYMLSMKKKLNVYNFVEMYNRNTPGDYRRTSEVYENMIVPLIDKGIISEVGEEPTKGNLDNIKNKILRISPVDIDSNMTRHLQI